MISYRLKGLLNCHTAILVVALPTYIYTVWEALRHILGGPYLSTKVNMAPYLLAAAAAMLAGHYFLSLRAPSYHRFSWVDAAQLSIRQVMLVALSIFGMMFVLQDRAVSRLITGSYLAFLPVPLTVLNFVLPRKLVQLAFQQHHRLPTLFIGSRQSLGRLSEWLAAKQVLGLQPVGFLSDELGDLRESEKGYRFLGNIGTLRRVIEQQLVAQVVVLDVPRESSRMRAITEDCQETGCRLLIYYNLSEVVNHPLVAVSEAGHQFFALQEEPLESPFNRLLKRGFDLLISVPVVLIFFPVAALLVLLMQWIQAPGPLFFVQKRSGYRNRNFKMIKFRSMYYKEKQDGKADAVQAVRRDERIYAFGRFLRRSSLDELPQFLNVLRGDMSIVGPRPHLREHDREFARELKSYRTRFLVKPGITGLAQCRGFRGEVTEPRALEQRIVNDLEYIAGWSIWLDLQIVFKTAWQVLFPPKSAY